MVERTIWLCLFCLALLFGAAAHGQMMPQGMVVRVEGELVFIDMGQRESVVRGDLFDIISSEVLTHPLTADSLGVTTKKVGAIQVLQVFDKLAVGKLVYLQGGQDAMLKQIVRIQDPERLVEIEAYMQHQVHVSMGGASRHLALIPGLYQLKTDDQRKGWTLLGLDAASLITAIGFRLSSDDWKAQYDDLPSGHQQGVYDDSFEKAQSRRNWSNRFFLLAGALYAYNWADVLWMGGGSPVNMQMGVGADRDGRAMLQLVHRF